VRGCLWRFEPFSPPEDDNAAGVPPPEDGVAVVPTSPSSPVVAPADKCDGLVFAPEAAPAK
jgi:hypothetical protein